MACSELVLGDWMAGNVLCWDEETWGRSPLGGRNEEFLALDLLDIQMKVSTRKSATSCGVQRRGWLGTH